MGKTGEMPGAWPERVVKVVPGVLGLGGSWWYGTVVGWAVPRKRLLRAGHTTASCLLMDSHSTIWRVADEGCAGLTEVLAAGVAARTWVGLDIFG